MCIRDSLLAGECSKTLSVKEKRLRFFDVSVLVYSILVYGILYGILIYGALSAQSGRGQ